jgi:hypothetical protein
MSKTKVDSTGIDLSDTFAFTGTVTGAGGITMVDQFRLTGDFDIPTSEGSITSNLERSDTRGAASFGSIQMSQSSGVFTFPSTGFYLQYNFTHQQMMVIYKQQ